MKKKKSQLNIWLDISILIGLITLVAMIISIIERLNIQIIFMQFKTGFGIILAFNVVASIIKNYINEKRLINPQKRYKSANKKSICD